ncbi:hypothetical protein QTP88_025757 [Uroleucon formosanum]
MPMHTENIILHALRLKAVGRKSDVTEVCTSIPDPRDLCSNKENLKSLIGSYGGKMGTTLLLRPHQLLRQCRNSAAKIVTRQDSRPISCAMALLPVAIGQSFDIEDCWSRKLS